MNKSIGWLSIIILSLSLVGCASKLTQENYEKIQNGMTPTEVRAILGKPIESSESSFIGLSSGSAAWKDKNGTITVQFFNGKVIAKQFSKEDAK